MRDKLGLAKSLRYRRNPVIRGEFSMFCIIGTRILYNWDIIFGRSIINILVRVSVVYASVICEVYCALQTSGVVSVINGYYPHSCFGPGTVTLAPSEIVLAS